MQPQDKTSPPSSKRVPPLMRFMYLLISPITGWKGIKQAAYKPDDVARNLFYPLLALMAACVFVTKLYQHDISVGRLLQTAIAEFVAMFAAYFIILELAKLILPGNAKYKIDTDFGKVFIMVALSGLSLAVTMYSILPNLGALLLVIPIYIAYLIAKGVRFLRLNASEQMPSIAVLIVLSIGIPAGIFMLLDAMMPSL